MGGGGGGGGTFEGLTMNVESPKIIQCTEMRYFRKNKGGGGADGLVRARLQNTRPTVLHLIE